MRLYHYLYLFYPCKDTLHFGLYLSLLYSLNTLDISSKSTLSIVVELSLFFFYRA